ncbi:YceI family protein [Kutzneria chonburiensis]|uniref:YceI family protein n=1 Tax=Kutzneria chonburiensis TaxID=1483604 RepID=A0ABV6MPZ4_9PSEU|nr:YceI family protein [Kutzneria chonburiensis]
MTIKPPSKGVYRIDTLDSRITFRAKHQFGTGTVRGSFGLTGGEIAVTVPPEESTVHAAASTLSFASGNTARDRKVKSTTFLDAEAYPEISFTSTSIEQVDGIWQLRGVLTARGAAAPAEFSLESLQVDAADIRIAATGKIDRYAHGITAMKGMAGRYLWLTVTVRATRQQVGPS